MVFVIATEATLFAVLLASYFYLRFKSPGGWPPDGIADPKLLKPAVMTVLLMTSSVTGWYLPSAPCAGTTSRGLRVGLASTFLLGAASSRSSSPSTSRALTLIHPSTDAYASLVLHASPACTAAHVRRRSCSSPGRSSSPGAALTAARAHLPVQTSALYWHFVHVVWLFLFLALYLSPRL